MEALDEVISHMSPQLIMCIVPNNRSDRYAAIKKKCCVDRAVPTQVVLAKNLNSKGIMSIATKIAVQINCKIGGTPWTVAVPLSVSILKTSILNLFFNSIIISGFLGIDGGWLRCLS